ncbi:MAG: serine/threonine-protein kinase [Lysobacteraceae bacterium]|nr:MAG: serine/threonine-protein kinase [Xanthomonadaceae bacterium]
MNPSGEALRWRRLSELFDRALDLEPPARTVLLDVECADDPSLRAELERMLAADASAHAFDQGPAALPLDEVASDSRDDTREIGKHLGHWLLETVLGRGGMGTVYAARRDDRDTEQRAALKLLHRRWDGSLQAQRFLQERRILASLAHPNIPHLIDHGLDEDQRPWFALELVQGRTLIEWADAHRLDLRARLELFRKVCAAVQHAHEHFVVHRDLKPDNILVDGEGQPKVLDFGVAKRTDDVAGATRTGVFVGFTPEYAAPEQVSGGVITASTDVYALGVILYQLLAGNLPYAFDHDDLRATTETITGRSATRLDQAITTGTQQEVDARLGQRNTDLRAFRRFVKGDLSRIVQTALAKEPPRRYASVQALSADLERFLDGRTVSVSGDTFAYRARKYVGRNRWGVAMASLALLALAVGITGVLMQTGKARASAIQAEAEARRANEERARAESEAERARASRDFLASLFAEASPENNHGENTTVREMLDRSKERIAKEFAEQPDMRVEMMTQIAATYSELSLYEDASKLLEQAVATADSTPAIAPEIRARASAEYAYVLLSESRMAEAEAQAHKAIALFDHDPPDAGLVGALGTLGSTFYLQGKFEQALAAQRSASDMTARSKGRDSDSYAESLLELSYFLDAADKPNEAVDAARHALRILEKQYPSGVEPSVSRALWALGNVLSSAGRDAEAIPLLRRAQVMVARIYGTDTLKYMRSLQLLGRAEFGAGELPAARRHLEQAMRLVDKHAPDHPISGVMQRYLGETLLRQGDAAAAMDVFQNVLRRLQRNTANGANLGDIITTLLARAQLAQGDPASARRLLDAQIPELRRSGSKQLARALVARSELARAEGDTALALASINEASSLLPASSAPIARIQLALEQARVHDAMGDAVARRKAANAARELLAATTAPSAPEFSAAAELAR